MIEFLFLQYYLTLYYFLFFFKYFNLINLITAFFQQKLKNVTYIKCACK